MNEKKAYGQSVRPFFIPWRWRDSNSRPNEELICFLHVYLRLHCRGRARPKPPTHPYPLKFRLRPEAYLKLSPILLHHLIGTLRSHSIRVMSRPATFAGIKLESTILRLKQRERNYFRQLIVRCLRFKCKPTMHYMLTNHFYPLSKPVIPMVL